MNKTAWWKGSALARRAAALASGDWSVVAGVATVNLLLAFVAFGKDMLFAGYFGTSATADAVSAAFLLPDTIGSNLVGYVLGIAAVPHLSRLWAAGRTVEFRQAALGLAAQSAAALCLIGVLIALLEKPILGAFGMSLDEATQRQLALMFRLLLPCLALFPLIAVGSAALQTMGSFYRPALAPVLLNAVMLAGLAIAWGSAMPETSGSWVYVGAILLGSATAAGFVWQRFRADTRRSVSPSAGLGLAAILRAPLRTIYRDVAPLFAVVLLTQCLYAAERLLAARLDTGVLASLNYAYRIAQFPNWVFIAALTTVILPALSRSSGHLSAYRQTRRAMYVTAWSMIPVALGMCAARRPIVDLLLGRGAFDADSAAVTSAMLAGYSLSVVGQAVSTVALRYFLADGRMRGVVGVYALGVIASLAFDFAAYRHFGPAALGYGAALGWSLNAAWMVGLLIREARRRG